jgi:Ni/Co efflux regulator RcnB
MVTAVMRANLRGGNRNRKRPLSVGHFRTPIMPKLMLSAAIAALLTAPALAQDHHRGGPGGGHGGPGQAPAASAPAAPQPHQDSGRGRGGFGQGSAAMNGRPRPAPGAPQAATPAPQPQAQSRPSGNWQGRHDDNRHGNGNAAGNNRPGFNPGNNTRPSPRPGDNNRPGFNPGNNTRPSPGFNNRPRRDYSAFRNYHRNFRSGRRFHAGSYHRPAGWYYRRWTFGQILPSLFWAQQYWLNDYGIYDLPPPPYGAVWVRYGNDALLIDRDTGEIITVEYDVFY